MVAQQTLDLLVGVQILPGEKWLLYRNTQYCQSKARYFGSSKYFGFALMAKAIP